MSCALLGTLELAFAADMPVASVEIVDAEMRTVGSVLMRSDGRRVVELSGSPSFIRIHMPDARLITLPVSGRQELLVSRDMVAPGFERRRALARAVNEFQISRLPRDPRIPNEEISAAVWEGRNVQHPPASAWDWRLDGGKRGRDELNWIFTGVSQRPFNLVGTLGQSSIRVRIPGNVRKLKIESSATLPPSAVKIQLNSRTQVLDALAGYLQSTDMIGTTYAINDLLKSGAPRIADPFAGCLLAYLLLRLRRFDEPALEVFRAAEKSQTPDAAVI